MPPQSARITLVSDVNFMLYTPLLPGAAGGHARAAPRRRAAARGARAHGPALGSVTGADPDRNIAQRGRRSRAARGDRLRPAHRRDRLGLADAAGARPRRARDRLQDAARGDRAAQPRPAHARASPRRSRTPPSASRCLTFVFVGAGYAGLEGLAELQDFAAAVIDLLPALPHAGHAVGARRGADRVMPEIPPSLAQFAARELRGRGIEIRTGDDASRRSRRRPRALDRR